MLPPDVLMFDHAGTVAGMVVAAGTARAITGAEVWLTPDAERARAVNDPRSPARMRVSADSAGAFVLLGGPGPATVSVRASGYHSVDTVITLEMERVETLQVALQPLPCGVGGR